MTLAKNIRYLRKKKGWSQEYIAEQLGYKSFTTIQKWESGVAEPPMKKFKALAELFQVDIDDLANKDLESSSADNKTAYYLDPEVAELAQEIYDNPGQRVLLDASRKLSKDDMNKVVEMIKIFTNDK